MSHAPWKNKTNTIARRLFWLAMTVTITALLAWWFTVMLEDGTNPFLGTFIVGLSAAYVAGLVWWATK